ncbi:MAG: oligosaccharide flippase family protein [Thiolinea sp.]
MLRKNILANYIGTGATVLAPILALPWYLELLGKEQFGLISFIMILQSLLGLLDAGLSQILVREIATRFDGSYKGKLSTISLVVSFERVYWLLSICIGIITLLLVDVIVGHWLQLDSLPIITTKTALYGAIIVFMIQFPASIYRSTLIGIQYQVLLNKILFFSTWFKHIGGILVLILIPSILSYLTWQIFSIALETLIRRYFAWKIIEKKSQKIKPSYEEIKNLWIPALGMSVSVLLGALTVQMDRIILSKMTTIEQLGYYTIAATVAIGLLQLISPLFQAALPRAVQMKKEGELTAFNIKILKIILIIITFSIILFSIASETLLSMWIHDEEAELIVHPILKILLIGTALNAIYNIGYMNWLVRKRTDLILQVNIVSLIIAIVFTPIFIEWYGTIGAALSWLVINLIGFILSLENLIRKKNENIH